MEDAIYPTASERIFTPYANCQKAPSHRATVPPRFRMVPTESLPPGNRIYRDWHRLLTKRLLNRANVAWAAPVGKGPQRRVPMRYTIDRIIRVLVTGEQWHLLESAIGSWQLHYHRFRKLVKLAVFDAEFERAGREYVARQGGIARILIDGSHIKARKGGSCTGPSPVDRGTKGSKMTVLTDEHSIPICATFCAGNEADARHLQGVLEAAQEQFGDLSQFQEILADKGYDSAANRAICRRHGLRPLILQRRPRQPNPGRNTTPVANVQRPRRPPRTPVPDELTQDEVRRVDRHRWAVERCFARPDNHRRVIHRQERLACVFRATQILSLTVIVCRRLERMGLVWILLLLKSTDGLVDEKAWSRHHMATEREERTQAFAAMRRQAGKAARPGSPQETAAADRAESVRKRQRPLTSQSF